MDERKESDADEIVFVVLVVGLGGGAFWSTAQLYLGVTLNF